MKNKIKKLMSNNIKLKTQEELLDSMVEDNQKMGLYEGPTSMDGYDTWDEIFTEIEDSLHSPIPVRVKNWLKNKFETPIKK
jgi:hypothetical protein